MNDADPRLEGALDALSFRSAALLLRLSRATNREAELEGEPQDVIAPLVWFGLWHHRNGYVTPDGHGVARLVAAAVAQ